MNKLTFKLEENHPILETNIKCFEKYLKQNYPKIFKRYKPLNFNSIYTGTENEIKPRIYTSP